MKLVEKCDDGLQTLDLLAILHAALEPTPASFEIRSELEVATAFDGNKKQGARLFLQDMHDRLRLSELCSNYAIRRLIDGVASGLNSENPFILALSSRSFLEINATRSWLAKNIKARKERIEHLLPQVLDGKIGCLLFDGPFQEFAKAIHRFQMGTRFWLPPNDDEFKHSSGRKLMAEIKERAEDTARFPQEIVATNVLSALDALAKRAEYCHSRLFYSRLCEYCHPNADFLNVGVTVSRPTHDTMERQIVRFAPAQVGGERMEELAEIVIPVLRTGMQLFSETELEFDSALVLLRLGQNRDGQSPDGPSNGGPVR
jgi:hypothetical protein